MLSKLILLSLVAFLNGSQEFNSTHRQFPPGFQFGVATASYQIEGAWNESDKGENIWDRLTHSTDLVLNGDTGDVACDSYHQYERDVEMLKELGVDFYRFSLSWSRILPTGFDNKISEDGIAYYNNLINLLISNGIRPVVTIYHWDLPQPLQDIGGWPNPLMEKYYTDYARVCFEAFGDRVTEWITLNEPQQVCQGGYGTLEKAPALNFDGVANYLCAHTLIKSHARVYHLFDETFRQIQNGRIGIVIDGDWYEPEDAQNIEDVRAAEAAEEFVIGLYGNPIFSETGDYPEVVKKNVAKKSIEQGYSSSRLPEFTAEEIEYIKGTADFFGFNQYSSSIVRAPKLTDTLPGLSLWGDIGGITYKSDDWPGSPASNWLKVTPFGFYKLLMWIKQKYNNPELIVMENGYSDLGGTSDADRINYYHLYMNAMMDAIEDGCDITGYTAWSLMDNFEWMFGYQDRFGLFSVDFEDPNRTRTAKDSAKYYASVISSKLLEIPVTAN